MQSVSEVGGVDEDGDRNESEGNFPSCGSSSWPFSFLLDLKPVHIENVSKKKRIRALLKEIPDNTYVHVIHATISPHSKPN